MAAAGVVVVEKCSRHRNSRTSISPGAINIPIKELDALARERLAPDHPVIVYCYDPL